MSLDSSLTGNCDNTWTSSRTLTIRGREYFVTWIRRNPDPPALQLRLASGSEVKTYYASPPCGGCNYLIYGIADPELCDGITDPSGPCNNVIRLKVEYANCGQYGITCDDPKGATAVGEELFFTTDPETSGFSNFYCMPITECTVYRITGTSNFGNGGLDIFLEHWGTTGCKSPGLATYQAASTGPAGPRGPEGAPGWCFEWVSPPGAVSLCVNVTKPGYVGGGTTYSLRVDQGPCSEDGLPPVVPRVGGGGCEEIMSFASFAPLSFAPSMPMALVGAQPPAPVGTAQRKRALALASRDCPYLGGRIPGEPCGSQLMACNLLGGSTTRVNKCEKADHHCPTCTFNPMTLSRPVPFDVLKIDPTGLAHVGDGRHFNCSLFRHKGRNLLAYRTGWSGGKIHVAELNDDFQPTSTRELIFDHPNCSGGQEDPRLFEAGGVLVMSFTGVAMKGAELITSVMLAVLGDDLQPVAVWEPFYADRTYPFEKNWVGFERDGGIAMVYSIRPHRILETGKLSQTAWLAHETPGPPPDFWPGWELRGGASPVRVGDEWYSFFHGWRKTDSKRAPLGSWYDYAVGVYTFDAHAPFAVKRCCRKPIWLGDPKGLVKEVTPDKLVIYPCGAVKEEKRWVVSAGGNDTDCLLGAFPVELIESVLEVIP